MAVRLTGPLEHGCRLGAGGISLWPESVVPVAADDALAHSSVHGLDRVTADLITIA